MCTKTLSVFVSDDYTKSFSLPSFGPDAVVVEPASGLGADLLDLYQRGEQCDITIQVAEQVFSCHR